MTIDFQLRFDRSQIPHWADRYVQGMTQPMKKLEERIECQIAPATKARGHLVKDDFLAICGWKSPRTASRCAVNTDDFIQAVSSTAISAFDEKLRIEVLTLLNGVEWPTASVILHFCGAERYPIIDFGALWTLGLDVPKAYDFDFWWGYTRICRRLTDESGETIRTLDRALWQFSKENQAQAAVSDTDALTG